MNIALIAPPWLAVPPAGYGGIERVVDQLANGLVDKGHQVTLYTIKDSKTRATKRWLFEHPQPMGRLQSSMAHLSFVFDDIAKRNFDVLHDHTWGEASVLGQYLKTPMLHTVHSPLNPEMRKIYRHIGPNVAFASISDFQQTKMPRMNWLSTVYNAVDTSKVTLRRSGKYLVFLGRFCPDKGLHIACEVAAQTGIPLIVAGSVNDEAYRNYYETSIKPYEKHPNIHFIGEVGETEKQELFKDAMALIFPIQWDEPFGMVLIEAGAAGVPVIAFKRGSVPEIIRNGVNGFAVKTKEEMVKAVHKLDTIRAERCRDIVEKRFSSAAMVDGYLASYESLIKQPVQERLHLLPENPFKALRQREKYVFKQSLSLKDIDKT